MPYLLIIFSITLIGLIIGTLTDLKTREVPDWLSYGLVFTGLSLNLIFTLIYWNYLFFLNSIVGFLFALAIALLMFYTGQWGGGDSKVLMGLGALIGLDITFKTSPFLISLLINILIVGAIYGLLWSFFLMFRNFKVFSKEFKKISTKKSTKKTRKQLLLFSIVLIILILLADSMLKLLLIALLIMTLITSILLVFIKAIEKTCMLKTITPDKLTEGDWIVKDIKYQGKYICGPKDLGIEKKQIRQLLKLYKQNKIKKVLIKEGIPFVPSFLIAYIITFLVGNAFLFLL